MECPGISSNQKGSASRNKQDLVGDLPSLGRMDPHFCPLGAAQSYPQPQDKLGWAQTGQPIQALSAGAELSLLRAAAVPVPGRGSVQPRP